MPDCSCFLKEDPGVLTLHQFSVMMLQVSEQDKSLSRFKGLAHYNMHEKELGKMLRGKKKC